MRESGRPNAPGLIWREREDRHRRRCFASGSFDLNSTVHDDNGDVLYECWLLSKYTMDTSDSFSLHQISMVTDICTLQITRA